MQNKSSSSQNNSYVKQNIDSDNLNLGFSASRLLTCKYCKLEFNLSNRIPLNLYCGHTFCDSCISKSADTICFICKEPYIRKPAKNHDLIQMLEELDKMNKKQAIAEESSDRLQSGIYSKELFSGENSDFVKKENVSSYYKGEYKDNKKHGYGKYFWASGAYYEGEFKDNYLHGYGKHVWADGNIYEGMFKEDKPNGFGRLIISSGGVYEGEWKDEQKNGTGKYIFTGGSVFLGEWRDDKKNGIGKYVWADGDVFEGEYKDNNKNGVGRQVWTDGNVYEGEYIDDKKHGIGKLVNEDGDTYEGEYIDDKRTGIGKYV